MVIESTCFIHKDIHKATWISPDGPTKNQIDHVLIDQRHFSDLLHVRSYRDAAIDSDHILDISKISARISNVKKAFYGNTFDEKFDVQNMKVERQQDICVNWNKSQA